MGLRHGGHGAKLDYRNIDIKCRGSDINCIDLPGPYGRAAGRLAGRQPDKGDAVGAAKRVRCPTTI